MARYFSLHIPLHSENSGMIREQVQAFGDYLPHLGAHRSATMAVHHTPAKERPTYDETNPDVPNRRTPTQLFTHTPAETEVVSAFSHSEMRTTLPIMASYLHRKYGNLTASSDLSEHSSKMVEHAQKLGLPVKTHEDNPHAEVTNDYGFNDYENIGHLPFTGLRGYKEIPTGEIAAAKEHYRELRGYKKPVPKHMGPQFTQPQLPGMENQ